MARDPDSASQTSAPSSQRPPITRIRTTDSAILATGEFGYPTGHLGHLTKAQEDALVAFKKLCQEKRLFKPAEDKNAASHDDTTLLRFLRARRFIPQDALQQFQDTEKWREENKIGSIYENIDVDDYDQTRKLYPQWTGRRDKRGIPLYLFEVAPLNSKTMSEYAKRSTSTAIPGVKIEGSTAPKLLRLFALYENLTSFVMPLCTALKDRQHQETPISQSNNIVDISNVGLKQFWNLRTHMQDASQLATAHYPETLDRIFIIGAPSFFPTVWGWIKRWFDPITTSKIFILSQHETYKVLSTFIDPVNIPTQYGGKLDFKFGYPPKLDQEEDKHIVWANAESSKQVWPNGPMKWVPGVNGTMVAIAVGSTGGKERREVVATFHPEGNVEEARKLLSRLSVQGEKVVIMPDEKTAEPVVLPNVKIETVVNVMKSGGANVVTPREMTTETVTKPTEMQEEAARIAEQKMGDNAAVPDAKSLATAPLSNDTVKSTQPMDEAVGSSVPANGLTETMATSAVPHEQVEQAVAMVGEHPTEETPPMVDGAEDHVPPMQSELNEKSMPNGQMEPSQRPPIERFVTAAETPSAMPS